jgi:uncharacterized Zn-finger protein
MSISRSDYESARKGTPHFVGAYHTEVKIGVRGFTCVGEYPPMDHPHIYLHIPSETNYKHCDYCNSKFIYDSTLEGTEAIPDCYVRPYDKRFV